MTPRHMNYFGPSMNPTLQVGDGLTVVPYEGQKPRVGDVVVFRDPEGEQYIAHRVASVDPEGVRTRGDNSRSVDLWILQPDNIVGRIVSAQRTQEHLVVRGGTGGKMLGLALRARKRLNSMLSKILHPAYHRLARSGLFRSYFPLQQKTRILVFHTPEGPEFQLLMGTRVIGRRPPGRDQWQIARPFRLFVDEASLPK